MKARLVTVVVTGFLLLALNIVVAEATPDPLKIAASASQQSVAIGPLQPTTEKFLAGPGLYTDPRYGYKVELPTGWVVYPTDPNAVIGTAELCNYDPQEIEDLNLQLPTNAICLQFGVGALAPSETFNQWLINRRASEMSPEYSGGYPASTSPIFRTILGPNDGGAFLLRGSSEVDVLEIDFANSGYAVSIAIGPVDSPALPEALQILESLQLMPEGVDLLVPPTSYEQVGLPTESMGSESYGPEFWSYFHLLTEWEDFIHWANTEMQPVGPTACSGAGSFDKGEAPTSPILLWMPFRNGETWRVGGDGSFYGNGWHGNCVNDYYATDWNRTDDYNADVLPAAPGTISYVSNPCLSSGLGCHVKVTHENGIKTTYGHLSQIYQSSGTAELGKKLGAVGETGCPGCGPHLHLGFHKLEGGSYYSRCNSGINGGKCPNGESPQSPQTPRPSPINTSSGTKALEDGNSYTSNNTSSNSSNCPNVTYTGVILYADKDCRGSEKKFGGPTDWINISDFNDVTSSIYVKSGWSVRVYEHAKDDQNGGRNRCITGSMWDLDKDYYPDSSTKIDNTISSVQVYNNGSCSGGTPQPEHSIQLYKEANWQGGTYCYGDNPGQYSNVDGCSGFNDAISSLLLKSGWSAWVFEHQSFGGGKKCYTGNDSDLSNDQFDNGQNVNDKISSFVLYNSTSCPAWETKPSPPTLKEPGDGATFIEGDSITLSWNSSSGASEYYGEFTSSLGANTFGWQSGTSKTIGAQWPGYEYSWHVKARNGAGESGYSGVWKFKVIPKSPSNVSASALSCTSVRLTWSDNSGSEDGYKVYRDGAEVGSVGANGTSYTDGVQAEKTYNYTVKAHRNGMFSNAGSASVTTPACPVSPPAPPVLKEPPNGKVFVEGEAISLSWNSSANATGYYGQIMGGPALLTFGWQAETSVAIGAQWPGYEYSWQVKARNSGGESSYTDKWKFTVIPKAPSSLNANVLTCNSVRLTWVDNSGSEDGYKVYRDGTEVGSVGGGVTSYTDQGLQGQTAYSYIVKAHRNGFLSNASNTATPSTCEIPKPDLVPFAPEGYQYPVVPTAIKGTQTSGPLFAGKNLFFDWHFKNIGNGAATGNFTVRVKIGDTIYVDYPYSNYAAGASGGFDDWSTIHGTPGCQIMTMVVDPSNAIAESNETNNTWQGEFCWETVNGWWAEFYNNETLSGDPVLVRDDADVDFYWEGIPPGPGVNDDHFSIRWTRELDFEGGNYRFTTLVDDGVKLWVDADLIIDAWYNQSATEYNVEHHLSAGPHTVTMEYYEYAGGAIAYLAWEKLPDDAPGTTDILAYARGTAPDAIWFATGNSHAPFFTRNLGFRDDGVFDQLVAGDFNGDGLSDIITFGRGTAPDALWFGTGNTQPPFFAKGFGFRDDGLYDLLVAGDFNGDSRSDILAFGRGTTADALWFATGNSQAPFFSKGFGFRDDGLYDQLMAGDFNGDGLSDILAFGRGTAADALWFATGNSQAPFFAKGFGFRDDGLYDQLVAGDFDGDGLSDILAFGRGTARDALWFATGNSQAPFFAKGFGFKDDGLYDQLVAGDFNGDGLSDILAYGWSSGADAIWLATGNSQAPFFTRSYGFVESTAFDVLIAGQFDGN